MIVDTATGEGVMMTMCRSYAVVNTHERCLDNIRHEVAHLITAGEEIDDHGPAWKAQAIRLGLKDPLAQVSEHNTRIPWFFHSFISKDCAKTQVRPLDKSA